MQEGSIAMLSVDLGLLKITEHLLLRLCILTVPASEEKSKFRVSLSLVLSTAKPPLMSKDWE